jgi:prolycopene isomerase
MSLLQRGRNAAPDHRSASPERRDAMSGSERYDAVVIGAGLGGLSTAAFLARKGWRVLVLEQSDRVGGCCAAYPSPSGKFRVERTLQYLMLCEDGGWVDSALRELGVREALDFRPLDPFVRMIGPAYDVTITSDPAQVEDTLALRFPSDAPVVRRVLRDASVFRRFRPPSEPSDLMSTREKAMMLWRMSPAVPVLFRYARLTVREGVAMFRDPSLRALIFSLVPRPNASFLATLYMLSLNRAYLPRYGGAGALVSALLSALLRSGGEVLLGAKAVKILVTRGRASAVRLSDGREFSARVVVSNADARLTFKEMVGLPHVSRGFLEHLETREVSPSAFGVWLGVDLDLRSLGHTVGRVIYNPVDDLLDLDGPDPWKRSLSINMLSLDDPGVAPPGHHTVLAETSLPYDYLDRWGTGPEGERGARYRELKNAVADAVIGSAERALPGLSRHILERDVSTPLTLERYTLNSRGAIHGWLQTPQNILDLGRSRTPVPGLYCVGHWAGPAGMHSVIHSGRNAGRAIIRDVGPTVSF